MAKSVYYKAIVVSPNGLTIGTSKPKVYSLGSVFKTKNEKLFNSLIKAKKIKSQ